MGGINLQESTSSSVGFAADLAAAAGALQRQPSVPLVSVAIALIPGALFRLASYATGGIDLWIIVLSSFAVMLLGLGWLGAERVFFQRQLQGRAVGLPHLLRLVRSFAGRFLALGASFGIIFFIATFGLARAVDVDLTHRDPSTPLPASLEVGLTALFIAADFALTFVTPALAYSTRSVGRALGIGLTLIARTWPKSALYVLCPPLALNLLNYTFPVGGVALQFFLTAGLVLIGLVAKGAIAGFYLRERGSYSDDGAAFCPRSTFSDQGRGEATVRQPRAGFLPDGTVCLHVGETSTYCTKCWANLYEEAR